MSTSILQDLLAGTDADRRHSHIGDLLPTNASPTTAAQGPTPDAITGVAQGGSEWRSDAAWSGPGLAGGSAPQAPATPAENRPWTLPQGDAPFQPEGQRPAAAPQLSQPILDTEIFEASAPLSTTTSTTLATTAPSPLLIMGVASNLAFRITWDTSVASAPSAFTTTIGSVAQLLANNLTSAAALTINLQVGWGSLNNSALPTGALGASSNFLYSYGSGAAAYGAFRSKLASVSSGSVIDNQILTTAAPSSSPIGAGALYFTSAQAKAIGAISGSQTSLDGYVGFANTNYLQTSGSGYDLTGVAEHELTEAMGRIMLSGSTFKTSKGSVSGFTSEDLMHFSSPGVRMLTTKGGYLSADGSNKLAYLNGQSSGDAADLASPTATQPNLGRDAFNAFASTGATTVSANDWYTMDALGWNLTPASGLTLQSVPTYLA